MKLHNNIRYKDLKNVSKIVLTKDILDQISKYFLLLQNVAYIDYNFESINIEIIAHHKINIFVEKKDEDYSNAIFFADEKKLVSFKMENAIDFFFYADNIIEYEELNKFSDNAEKLILFVLEWYPRIIYYIQEHSQRENSTNFEDLTFFLNTRNNKL